MEIRLRPILLSLLLAAIASAAATISLPRLWIGAQTSGTPAAPTIQAAGTLTLASQCITFADESAAWDWQVACQDALATWAQ